jgi:hypothetical protein
VTLEEKFRKQALQAHPAEQTLLVYKLGEDEKYGAADRYAGDDKVAVPLLGDLVIELESVREILKYKILSGGVSR